MTNNAQDSLIEKIPDTLAVRELDRFVKITEAARILGYASYQSVKQLVDEQILISYSLPETSRPRLLLSELLVLKARKDNSLSNSISHKITEKRGRPKKYGVH
jgi:hypothetical protein